MTENEISREIVDTAFQAHTKLGPGLLETVDEVILPEKTTGSAGGLAEFDNSVVK